MNSAKEANIKVNVKMIHSFMDANRLSQAKFSKLAGLSPTTVATIIKTGTCKKYTSLHKLATAMKVNLQDLID